jgi:hypothetical protein
MTVCIAAIAEKGKAIVCIADRSLTFKGVAANTETDSGVTKIVPIPKTNWCAMFSGDSLTFPERVLGLVTEAVIAKKPAEVTRKFIEDEVKVAFEKCWEREVEDQILKPNLLSVAAFTAKEKDARLADTKFIATISDHIANYQHVCSMAFCGFDSAGAHIVGASTPCQIDPYDWQGFLAIGAGEDSARNQLIWSEYEKEDDLDSVLYDVFNAKVATEVLQGVGYQWDWRVIVPHARPKPIPKKIDRLIDRVWTVYNRSPYAPKLKRLGRLPRNWKKQISDYTSSLLSPKLSSSRKSRGQQ